MMWFDSIEYVLFGQLCEHIDCMDCVFGTDGVLGNDGPMYALNDHRECGRSMHPHVPYLPEASDSLMINTKIKKSDFNAFVRNESDPTKIAERFLSLAIDNIWDRCF